MLRYKYVQNIIIRIFKPTLKVNLELIQTIY